MDKDQIRTVVIETMNILENDYGVQLESVFAPVPTVDAVAERILAEHFTWPGNGQRSAR